MDANEILESYVRDVADCLPRARRDDVASELRSLLAEELAGRAQESGRPPDRAMAMAMLQAFGRPAEYAQRYHARPALVEMPSQSGPVLEETFAPIAYLADENSEPTRVLEARRRDSLSGDGLVRAIRFLSPVTATITTERRRRGPYGLAGGEAGAPGRNTLLRDGQAVELPGKVTLALEAGDVIRLETPGGGGWGEPG